MSVDRPESSIDEILSFSDRDRIDVDRSSTRISDRRSITERCRWQTERDRFGTGGEECLELDEHGGLRRCSRCDRIGHRRCRFCRSTKTKTNDGCLADAQYGELDDLHRRWTCLRTKEKEQNPVIAFHFDSVLSSCSHSRPVTNASRPILAKRFQFINQAKQPAMASSTINER